MGGEVEDFLTQEMAMWSFLKCFMITVGLITTLNLICFWCYVVKAEDVVSNVVSATAMEYLAGED